MLKRYLLAWVFKIIFKVKYLRRYYFAVYKRLFKPLNLFRGVSLECTYSHALRIKADLEDWIQQNIFFTGVYDSRSVNFVEETLDKGDTFIDIGANIGCFTLVASRKVGPGGRVIAFEPVDLAAKKLEHNVLLNRLDNVSIVRKAVYDSNRQIKLYLARSENLGMSSILRHDSESGETKDVEAISLDEYLTKEHISEVKMIKIDIEGAELPALKGMDDTLSRCKPVLLVEVSPDVITSSTERSEVFDLLRKKNYVRFVIQNDGQLIPPDDQDIDNLTNFVFIQKEKRL